MPKSCTCKRAAFKTLLHENYYTKQANSHRHFSNRPPAFNRVMEQQSKKTKKKRHVEIPVEIQNQYQYQYQYKTNGTKLVHGNMFGTKKKTKNITLYQRSF